MKGYLHLKDNHTFLHENLHEIDEETMKIQPLSWTYAFPPMEVLREFGREKRFGIFISSWELGFLLGKGVK